MIAVDSSAVFAVLFEEPEALRISEVIVGSSGLLMTLPTLIECHYVIHGYAQNNSRRILDAFIAGAGIEIVPIDAAMADNAVDARYRYGKGTGHRANLNFGDCFSYALAKSRNLPLLFKGDDFIHTDIRSALQEA